MPGRQMRQMLGRPRGSRPPTTDVAGLTTLRLSNDENSASRNWHSSGRSAKHGAARSRPATAPSGSPLGKWLPLVGCREMDRGVAALVSPQLGPATARDVVRIFGTDMASRGWTPLLSCRVTAMLRRGGTPARLGSPWRQPVMPGSQPSAGFLAPATRRPRPLDALPGVLMPSNARARDTAALAFPVHMGACGMSAAQRAVGISSALTAPRCPGGRGGPTVVSRVVWASVSELISAPSRTTRAVIQSHSSSTTTPARLP